MLRDPRFADDVHVYCPTCAVQDPFVIAARRAFAGLGAGLPLAEIAPEPTDALVDAVVLFHREVEAREAQRRKDRAR